MIEYDHEKKQKKKKRKEQSKNTWLVVGIVAGILLLIGVVVIVVVINLPRGDHDVQAKGNAPPVQAPVQPQPLPREHGLPKKGPPKGLVQSVRAAAYRPERLNELRQIGIFFNQLYIETNKNPRTKEEFIDYIKRDAGSIAQALQEDYYLLNLKVNMRDANAVIAYESLQDQGGFQAVRVDASVAPIPLDELKKLVPDIALKN